MQTVHKEYMSKAIILNNSGQDKDLKEFNKYLLLCTSHRALKSKAIHTPVCLVCWFLSALPWVLSNSSCALNHLPLFLPCSNMPQSQNWYSDSNKPSGNSWIIPLSCQDIHYLMSWFGFFPLWCFWGFLCNTKLCTLFCDLRTEPACPTRTLCHVKPRFLHNLSPSSSGWKVISFLYMDVSIFAPTYIFTNIYIYIYIIHLWFWSESTHH